MQWHGWHALLLRRCSVLNLTFSVPDKSSQAQAQPSLALNRSKHMLCESSNLPTQTSQLKSALIPDLILAYAPLASTIKCKSKVRGLGGETYRRHPCVTRHWHLGVLAHSPKHHLDVSSHMAGLDAIYDEILGIATRCPGQRGGG